MNRNTQNRPLCYLGTVGEKHCLGEEVTVTDVVVSVTVGAGTGALFNSTSSGAASILENVTETAGKYVAKNIVKNYWKQFCDDFGINVLTEALNNFFTWFLTLPFGA